MSEEEIIDVWNLFREYVDKKHIEHAAERYIDLLADYGVEDQVLVSVLGHDVNLDQAVNYYLDIDDNDEEDY